MNCPRCSGPVDMDFNFCPACEQQVRCLSCGRGLLAGKTKCLYCGTPLGISQQHHSQMNTFSLEENQTDNSYSRKINLAFTDNAIDKVAPALSGYVPLARARRVAEKRD